MWTGYPGAVRESGTSLPRACMADADEYGVARSPRSHKREQIPEDTIHFIMSHTRIKDNPVTPEIFRA